MVFGKQEEYGHQMAMVSTNFEKFRKEVRSLIQTDYSVKMEYQSRELKETKG